MSETISVSVTCTIIVPCGSDFVKQLEEQIGQRVAEAARQAYQQAMYQYQQRWLQQRCEQYQAVRWRSIRWLTPFGLVEIPNRVVRRRDCQRGGYLSLAKALLRGKATRLLSPRLERQALEAAVEQNYRPAARRLSESCGQSLSHWTVWQCVQYYGEKLREQVGRGWWPDQPLGSSASVVVTELDSTWLRQQRGRATHFLMHLGLHYTGRQRRSPGRGRRDVSLAQKIWWMSSEALPIFGRRVRLLRDRHYIGRKELTVVLSDGDEGIERVREAEFGEAKWLLDRWHIAERVRGLVGSDQGAYRRIMDGVWASDSEAVLEALRQMGEKLAAERPKEYGELFGYIVGNREGIEAYREIPGRWRRSRGRQEAVVRAGSGAVEKNIEVCVNRRFKRQGRSWNAVRADRLAQLSWLRSSRVNWNHWWDAVCLTTTKVNPSWASN